MTTITVAQALTSNATGLTISDTESAVFANLAGLLAKKANIASIALTDAQPSASITTAQLVADAAILGKITTHYTLVITGTALTVAQVQTIQTALATVSGTAVAALLADVGAHGLTVSDTATNLAALTVQGATLLANQNIAITTTATVAQLSAIQVKVVTATLAPTTIGDTTANLINVSGTVNAFVKPGVAITVTTAATVAQLTAIHAANTTGTLTANIVTDTAANLFGGTGVGPLSTFVKAGVAVTVTTPTTIAQLTAIHAADTSGTVTASTIVDSVANFTPANITLYVKTGVHVTVNDNVANLVAAAAVTGSIVSNANTTSINITDSLVNVAASLHALTALKTATRTVTATMTATAAQLLDTSNASALALETSITLVADQNGANTVTVAQGNTLEAIKNFNTGGVLTIADTAANLTSSAAQTMITKAANGGGVTVLVSDSAKITVAVAKLLTAEHATLAAVDAHQLPVTLTINDTVANLHANLGALAIATTVTVSTAMTAADVANLVADINGNPGFAAQLNLSGATIASGNETVAQIATLKGAGFAGAYSLSDSAANLLADSSGVVTGAAHIYVSGTPTEANIAALLAAPAFAAANLSLVTTPVLGLSLAEAAWASSHKLAHFGLSATAADLLNAANATILAGATAVTLAPVDTGSALNTVTVAQALKLETLVGFTAASGTLTIADTVTNLTSASMTKALAFAHVTAPLVQIDTSAAVSVATLTKLSTIHATAASGVALTLQDTTANVLAAGVIGAVEANIIAMGVTGLTLTGSLTGANLGSLVALEAAVTVSNFTVDLTHAVITGTLTVAQATLAVDGHYSGGYSITDTAANVLDSGVEVAVISGASTIFVAGSATASQFETLLDLSNAAKFNLASLTINLATAAQLLDPSIASHLATTVGIDPAGGADNVVTVVEAEQLQHIHGFSAGGRLTISDTVANLASSASAAAIAALNVGSANSVTISDSAVINAATATTLGALNATAANGVTVNLVDTTANITALGNTSALTLATSLKVIAASDTLADYNSAAALVANYNADVGATHSHTGSVVLPAGQTAVSLDYLSMFANNTAYVAALEAAGVTITITTTQDHYSDAVAALNGYVHGSVSLAQSSAETVTLTYANFVSTGNAAYVHSLEAAGDIIVVTTTSNSLADYNAAVLALHGYGNGSVALGPLSAVTLTYNDFTSTANTAYVTALKASGAPITLTATSTALTDYNAALSALGNYGHGSSVTVPVLTSAVTLSYGDFISNSEYVAALELAGTGLTTIINVTAASDSVADYTALATYITDHSYTHISVAVPSSATPITLTYADFTADTAYVAAMGVAGNSLIVTGVPAANAETVHTTAGVSSYTVVDTATNLLANAADAGVLAAASITLSANDGADLVGLTVAQVTTLFTTLRAASNGNTYSVTDTIADLNAGSLTLLNGATVLNVTGALTAANIDTLESSGYTTTVNLSAAMIAALTVSEAGYAQAHAGSYAISDSIVNINAATALVANAATVIDVTGPVTSGDIDTLIAAGFTAPIDLSGALITLTTATSGADANYVFNHAGTYSISGLLPNVTTAAAALLLHATTISVTGSLVGSDINTLLGETYASKIDLSGAIISSSLTVAEAAFAHAHTGAFTTISDSVANVLAGVATADLATTVNVTGAVAAGDIDALGLANITSTINLSLATVTLTTGANAAEANYVFGHGGSYTLNDTFANITNADATLLSHATSVAVTDTITAANVDTLIAATYASAVDLSNATISTALSVDEATYVEGHAGLFGAISDTAANIISAASGVLTGGGVSAIDVTGPVTAAQVDALSGLGLSSEINMGGATISEALNVTEAAFVYSVTSGSYATISDLVGNITAANANVVNAASAVDVTGAVTVGDIDTLSGAIYKLKVDLSGAQVTLPTTATAIEANYVHDQQGTYALSGTIIAFSTANATLLANAASVAVTGPVAAGDIDALLGSGYAVKVDLSGADSITDPLTVTEASYAHTHNGTYATISDSFANITAAPAADAVGAATTLHVTGPVTAANIDTLTGASYATAVNLGGATVTLTTAATADEATFVNGHGGSYSLTDSVLAITTVANATLLAGATAINVTGTVVAADIDTLEHASYTALVDLSSATPITASLTVEEATYADAHNGQYATISDVVANVLAGDVASLEAADTIEVTGAVSGSDIDVLIGKPFAVDLSGATVSLTTAATSAEAMYVHNNSGSYTLTDSATAIINADHTVLLDAQALVVTGTVTAGNIDTLIGDTTHYHAVSLNGTTINDPLTVDEATYAHAHSGTYSAINDSAANLIAAGSTDAVNAAEVHVTGVVTGGDVDTLSGIGFTTYLDFSEATVSLTLSDNGTEAGYVFGHGGHIALTGTVAAITAADQTLVNYASTLHVTGTVSQANIDTLQTAGYPATIDLSTASTITDPLTVSEATYVSTSGGHYVTISDSYADVTSVSALAVVNAATTVDVTGPVTAANVLALTTTSITATINLSGATISDSLTVAEAFYVYGHAGSYATISDTVASVLFAYGTQLPTLNAATTVDVTGPVTSSDIDALVSDTNIMATVNLGGAEVTLLTTADATESSYVHNHNGTYALTGDFTAITTADSTLLGNATALDVTGTVTAAQVLTLSGETYSAAIDLSGATISGTLTVAEAIYANTQHGAYATISDTVAAITAGPAATAVGAATTTVDVTGAVTASDITTLSAEAYAAKVNLGGASVSLTTSASGDVATFVHGHGGTYSLSANFTNITTVADATLLLYATSIAVTGAALTGANIDTLSGETYATKIDLSGATITGALNVTEAGYVHTQNGTYATISDTFANITAVSAATLVGLATTVDVTGAVTAANITTLSGASYAVAVNLSGATISNTLTVLQAVFANAHNNIVYTVTDTTVNVLAGANGVLSAASTVYVTGPVSLGNIDTLMTDGYAVNLSNATVTLDTTANSTEATYVAAHNGTYVLSGSIANVLAADATVLANATAVSVTGAITTGNIDTLSAASYATKVDLSGATISATLSVAEAAYANAQHGTYAAITGSATDYASASGTLTASAAVFAGKNVTVTSVVDVAQLHSIETATGGGTVTLNGITDTAANFASAGGILTSNASALLPSMNVTISGVADLAQLVAIQGAIGTGVMTNHGVSDTAANLFSTGVTFSPNADIYVVAGENVTVTGNGASAPDLDQLQTIKQMIGGGTLTYTSVSDSYLHLSQNLNAFVTGAVNVTVTDQQTIANLVGLQAETTGTITALNIVDTAANVQSNSSFVKGGGVTSVTLYDTAAHLLNSSYSTAVGEATAIHIMTASGTADTISAANLQTLESEAPLNAIDGGINALTISDSVSNLNSAINNINAITSGGHAPAVNVSTVSTVSAAVAETFYTNYALGESVPGSATAVNTSYNAGASSAIIISDSVAHIVSAANLGAFNIASAVDVTGSVNSASLLSLALLDPTAAKIDLSGATLSMASLTGAQVAYLDIAGGSTSAANIAVTNVGNVPGILDLGSVSNATTIALTMAAAASGTIVLQNAVAVTNVDISAITGETGYTVSNVGGNLQIDVTGTTAVHIELVGVAYSLAHTAVTVH